MALFRINYNLTVYYTIEKVIDSIVVLDVLGKCM